MELLTDRLSVWQAVADLGTGVESDSGNGKANEVEGGMQGILRRFWEEIMVTLWAYLACLSLGSLVSKLLIQVAGSLRFVPSESLWSPNPAQTPSAASYR